MSGHRNKNKKGNEHTRSTQIVCVAILLAIYQLYCFGIEAVKEPVGARLDAPLPLAVQKQEE